MKRFILLTTHQIGRGRQADLLKLLRSVEHQRTESQLIELHVLLQGTENISDELAVFSNVQFHLRPQFMSLSKARNDLISSVQVGRDDYVLFPDDDCWYPPEFFSSLKATLSQLNPDAIFWSFSEEPAKWPEVADFKAVTAVDAMRRGVSNAFCFKGSVIAQTGLFDEALGLGTPSGGGEDLDYAYRSYRKSENAIITKAKLVGHRSATKNFQARVDEMTRYWETAMFVTLKHFEASLALLVIYRLAVGVFLLCIRRLTFKRFSWPFKQILRP